MEILCTCRSIFFSNYADLYALSRYANANTRPSVLNSEASHLAESEQVESKQNVAEPETENEKSELRLAQIQHQLPSNEPGALMHLVEEPQVPCTKDFELCLFFDFYQGTTRKIEMTCE